MKIKLLILCGLISPLALGQKHKTDWEKYGLKGKVKSMHEVRIDSPDTSKNSGEADTAKAAHTIYGFNDRGYLETETFYGKGHTERMWKYGYYSPNDILYKKSYSKYDSAGPTINFCMDDSTRYKYKYKNYPSVELLEMDCYNSKGGLIFKEFHNYDKKGNETREEYQDDQGESEWTINYRYDDAGDRLESIPEVYCPGCHLQTTRDSSAYDKNGRVVTSFQFKSKWDTKWFLKLTFTYNDKGDIASLRTVRDMDGKKSVAVGDFEYTYDVKGNWIERKNYQQNVLEGVVKRLIEYYK